MRRNSIQKQLTLTQQIEVIDDIDKTLLEEILLIVQNRDTFSLVSFWGHNTLKRDKSDEEFFKKIMLSVNALIKANALRRNYHKIKDVLIDEIKKDPSIRGAKIDMLFNKVDAFILIEGFFSQVKTALDLLAQSLKPIYGYEFHTWAKKNNVSGMEIVSVLTNNLNKDLKPRAGPIIDLIKKNAESISRIVSHRDDTVHYGKLNKVQGFSYSMSKNEIIPPLILINNHESAFVHEYLDEALRYIADFTQEFVVTLLSNLVNGMIIIKRDDGSWGWVAHNLNNEVINK